MTAEALIERERSARIRFAQGEKPAESTGPFLSTLTSPITT
jgi:hypothetical protein